MAVDPATVTLIAKTALAVLTDKKARKTLGWIIALILSPIIVIVVLLIALLNGASAHNNDMLEYCFSHASLDSVPTEYKENIKRIRQDFSDIESLVSDINSMSEDESLDELRVKAVFYSLYFGEIIYISLSQFTDSFIRYEKRTRTWTDNDGEEHQESYRVSIPLPLPETYKNLASKTGKPITDEDKINASEVYYRILYGKEVPTYGGEFDDFINNIPLSNEKFVGKNGFCSPLGEHWRSHVSSEFGYRVHPFTGKKSRHGGIDIAVPKDTPIRVALDGSVLYTRYANTGYGYHLVVDHGGGFITLYAHCSKILAEEGQKVTAGDVIAKVGSTGRSTGNHLHFEIRINGEKKNPRDYLP